MRRLPTGTVTFLFTDVEGSTALARRHGAERWSDELERYEAIVGDLADRHGGVAFGAEGDGVFCVFAAAGQAVAAARAVQETLSGGHLRARAGIHTGSPLLRGGDYTGVDVHLAARVCDAGHGGQVLLSAATREALGDGTETTAVGSYRLRGFAQPVALFQLGCAAFPPLRATPAGNVPDPASPLLGRDAEVEMVVALLQGGGSRLVTLVGPGGVGKTRLALEVALRIQPELAGSAYFVPLAAVRDPRLVASSVVRALGVDPGAPDGLRAAGSVMEPTLVVVDNVEQVVAAAPALADLLAALPALRMLVTSREALRVRAEHLVHVAPLEPGDGVALFRARAEAAGAPVDDTPSVHELCARLDHLPLALELAAARTRLLTPAQLLDRLSVLLDLAGGRDQDPRHRTLRATIAWSVDTLDEDERRLFARFSIFAGGATLDTVEAVCESGAETLLSLLDKSLVRRRDADREPRFWMLETIREYAAARLAADAGEATAFRSRYARWCSDLLSSSQEVFGDLADAGAALARLDAEQANVLAALSDLDTFDEQDSLLEAATVAAGYLDFRGRAGDAAAILDGALARAPDASIARARALGRAGALAWMHGEPERGGRLLRESLAEARELGEDQQIARSLQLLGSSLVAADDLEGARPLLDEALELDRRSGDAHRIAVALLALSNLYLNLGDWDAAITAGRESVATSRTLDVTVVLNNIALAHAMRGDTAEALAVLSEALDERERLALDEGGLYELLTLAWLGRVDHPREAAGLLEAMAAARRRDGFVLEPFEQRVHDEALAAIEVVVPGTAATVAAPVDVPHAEAIARARAALASLSVGVVG